MGAKISKEMLKAKKMVIEQGASAYEAAKQCGLTRQAIYMSAWYKQFRGLSK